MTWKCTDCGTHVADETITWLCDCCDDGEDEFCEQQEAYGQCTACDTQREVWPLPELVDLPGMVTVQPKAVYL